MAQIEIIHRHNAIINFLRNRTKKRLLKKSRITYLSKSGDYDLNLNISGDYDIHLLFYQYIRRKSY